MSRRDSAANAALRRGSAEAFKFALSRNSQNSGRGFGDGLHLATVDQAEIRGLETTGQSVRRGAASDYIASVTLIALPRLGGDLSYS